MSDPCAGHVCDGCPTCVKGRCCRRDNAGYVLPEEGSWQPVYGAVGVRNTDGERMECHACGAWYVALQKHIWARHDLTVGEYRALFGLSQRGLIGERLRATRQQTAWANADNPAWAANPIMPTPEQLATRRPSTEGKRAAAAAITVEMHRKAGAAVSRETHVRAGRLGGQVRGEQLRVAPIVRTADSVERGAAKLRRREERRCVVCGRSYSVVPSSATRTCSPECLHETRRQSARAMVEARHGRQRADGAPEPRSSQQP